MPPMRSIHRQERDTLVLRVLDDPVPLLRELLTTLGEWFSSNEIGAETGVPGSVVRSIRNGTAKTVKTTTLTPLLRWSLWQMHPRSFPELGEYYK